MGLRMSEEEERLGADYVEHGLTCRLEFPDGTIIHSTDADVLGSASKMAVGMKVSKVNKFLGAHLKTLTEEMTCETLNNNTNNAETRNGISQMVEADDDVNEDLSDVQSNGNVVMTNGIYQEMQIESTRLSRNNSSRSSMLARIRKRDKVEGQSNLGFNEENRDQNFF